MNTEINTVVAVLGPGAIGTTVARRYTKSAAHHCCVDVLPAIA